MTTGQGQFKAAHQFTVFKEVGNGAVAPLLVGNRCKGDACGAFDRPPMAGFEPLAQHRVVVVGQEPCCVAGEPLQGGDQGFEVGVVVRVVELDVGEHAEG